MERLHRLRSTSPRHLWQPSRSHRPRTNLLDSLKHLIDTDWAVHHLRGNRRITRRIEELLPEGIGVSIISIAELYEGVANSSDPHQDEATLLRFLDLVQILPLNTEICALFGTERARLRANGTLIGDLDLLIGCTALHHDLTILTNNIRHFKRIQNLNLTSA